MHNNHQRVLLAAAGAGFLAISLGCGSNSGAIEVTLVNDSLETTHMWAFDEEMERRNRLDFGEARTAWGEVQSTTLEQVPVFAGRNGLVVDEGFCTFAINCMGEDTPVLSAVANYNGSQLTCVETSECVPPGQ